MVTAAQRHVSISSLPSRERGLKFWHLERHSEFCFVAPFTGAWIEIRPACRRHQSLKVAPFTGAWIEMAQCHESHVLSHVAPFTGAWIEICCI